RLRRPRCRADDRADIASRIRLAMAQSCARAREAPRDSATPQGERPRAREVVSLKIAILGTRGVPPAYGGFETLAGELSTRLAHRGHDVYVYCRSGAAPASGAALSAKPAAEAAAAPLCNPLPPIELPATTHTSSETASHTPRSPLCA